MNMDVIMKDIKTVIEQTLQDLPEQLDGCYIDAMTDRIQIIIAPMIALISKRQSQLLEYQDEIKVGEFKEETNDGY